MDNGNKVMGMQMKRNKKNELAFFLPVKRHWMRFFALCAYIPLTACHTMVFVNQDQPLQADWQEPSHYHTSVTNHEGVVGMVAGKPLNLESACGQNSWRVIKTESTLKDAMIGFIFNPLYSSTSVLIDCKSPSVAQQ
jgi:Bor protein